MLQRRRWLRRIPVHVLLIIGSATMLLPFFWMVTTSFKQEGDIFVMPPKFIGIEYTLSNYRWLFDRMPFFLYMGNTLMVTVTVVAAQLATSALGGYAFARFRFRFRDQIFLLYLAAMMVPGFVTLVPSFILFRTLGLYDTHWPLILPGVTSAFGTFLMRQFFMGIPKELEEAATVDGCSPPRILAQIFLPLSKPAMTTLAIFIFNGVWNDYPPTSRDANFRRGSMQRRFRKPAKATALPTSRKRFCEL